MKSILKKITGIAVIAMVFGIAACSEEKQQQSVGTQPEPGQIAETAQVSNDELLQFAEVMSKLEPHGTEAQQEMISAIEETGLNTQRYQEIAQAQQQGSESEVTQQEQSQFEESSEKMQQIQARIQQEQQEMVQESGLTLQRFQEISDAIRQDSELRQRYMGIIQQERGTE